MSLSFKKIKKLIEQFDKEYSQKPWSDYISWCGISKVIAMDKNAPDNEKEDLCISVGLLKPLPSNLVLPKKYRGARVYSKVVGKFKLH